MVEKKKTEAKKKTIRVFDKVEAKKYVLANKAGQISIPQLDEILNLIEEYLNS